MKKYITTKEHYLYKEGLEINDKGRHDDHINLYDSKNDFCKSYPTDTMIRWLKNGWIEEIQQAEFTRDDMEKAFEAGMELADAIELNNKQIPFTEWIEKHKK